MPKFIKNELKSDSDLDSDLDLDSEVESKPGAKLMAKFKKILILKKLNKNVIFTTLVVTYMRSLGQF